MVSNALLSALSQSNPKLAVQLYKDISMAITPDVRTINAVMYANGIIGDWEDALEIFRTFQQQDSEELNGGEWAGVKDTKFHAKPLEVLYNTLITICGLCKQWKMAEILHGEMLAGGAKASVVTYGALMLAYEKSGRAEDALALITRMKNDQVKPNEIVYNTAMFACVGSHPLKGVELFESMEESGLKCTEVSYLAAIQCMAELKNWEASLDYFDEMRSKGLRPKTETYNGVMNAFVQSGEWERALYWFQFIEEGGEPGDDVQADVVTFNTGLNACVQMRNWRLALEVFNKLESSRIEPDIVSFNTLIKALGDANRPVRAEKKFYLLQNTPGVRADEISYNTLLKALGDSGDWEGALDLYRSMREDPHVSPDAFTYNKLFKLLDDNGVEEVALEVAYDLASSNVTIDAYTLSILASARTFDNDIIAKAVGLNIEEYEFTRLRDVVSNLMTNNASTIREPAILFNALIGATKRDWEMALAVMGDMERFSVQADAITFDSVINVQVRAGQWAMAKNKLREMQERGIQPNSLTFSNVVNACVSRGQWSATLRELERTRGKYRYNFLAYNVLMAAYSNGGQLQEAFEIYAKMSEVDAPVNVVAYSAFLRACGRDSRWVDAMHLMQEMREKSVRPSSTVQNQLVLGMLYAGALNDAMDVLEIMHEDHAPVSPQAFRAVAHQLRCVCPIGKSNVNVSMEDDRIETDSYMDNLKRKLQLYDVPQDQCEAMATLLDDIAADNPCVLHTSEALEIWGGEELEGEEAAEDADNFVRFVQAGIIS
uniref:Pentacotripeptide-repeat region of PRORP domain-containing protein n=1 Tax=Lotharella globosa TaxID=91324 RepID=A0A7S3Z6F4_9EUKA